MEYQIINGQSVRSSKSTYNGNKVIDGVEINEESLGIGCLAYLKKLTINDVVVFNAETSDVPGADETPAEDNEEQTNDQ